jgi:porphobilinogen synthase
LGINVIALFPHLNEKIRTADAKAALDPDGLIAQTCRAIKAAVPDIGLLVDIALDPYTDHGHDGLLIDGKIANDATIEMLVQQSLALTAGGADILAPSDMMDGRIGAIRGALEMDGHIHTRILAYSAKYASSFYGPFRDAVGSAGALSKGNKFTYQMDPANSDEALREVALDLEEGADMIMVKPALAYLDIVRRVKDAFGVPVAAYNVSGEYAMIKAAVEKGYMDHDRGVMETLLAFKRAGASGILTYFAKHVAELLKA